MRADSLQEIIVAQLNALLAKRTLYRYFDEEIVKEALEDAKVASAVHDLERHPLAGRELFYVNRLLLEQAPDAVFLHRLDGRFVFVNDAACAILGYSRDELLTMHPWDFVVNDSRADILALWRAANDKAVAVCSAGMHHTCSGAM